jgi:hypothetical protein
VITTQLTPDLNSSELSFYNYDNGSPEIKFADWMLVVDASPPRISSFCPCNISISYAKQNPAASKLAAVARGIWRHLGAGATTGPAPMSGHPGKFRQGIAD